MTRNPRPNWFHFWNLSDKRSWRHIAVGAVLLARALPATYRHRRIAVVERVVHRREHLPFLRGAANRGRIGEGKRDIAHRPNRRARRCRGVIETPSDRDGGPSTCVQYCPERPGRIL